jgi:hypothetical protein
MDELSEEDEWLAPLPSPSSDGFQRQFSDAIALVLRDADTVLGQGVITHVVDEAEEQFMREIGPDVERPPGHLVILGRPGGGFSWHSEMTWPDYVISAAEGIQEAVFEGDDFWGMPFPSCPVHPNHPLVPAVVDGTACWTCARGSIEPIEIGHLADSINQKS